MIFGIRCLCLRGRGEIGWEGGRGEGDRGVRGMWVGVFFLFGGEGEGFGMCACVLNFHFEARFGRLFKSEMGVRWSRKSVL